MKKTNPLIKSTIIYLISSFIGQGMSFLGIIVFTRLMSKTAYGNYMTYYAYVSVFTVLVGANLYYSLNNAYIEKKSEIEDIKKSLIFLSAIIAFFVLIFMEVLCVIVLNKHIFLLVLLGVIHSYGFFLVTYRIYAANMENDFKTKALLLIFPNLRNCAIIIKGNDIRNALNK